MKAHTVTALRQAMETSGHAPGAFRIHQIGNEYELEFMYGTIGVQPWKKIQLRDGKTKVYKSLNAMFSDIEKLREDADETMIAYTNFSF